MSSRSVDVRTAPRTGTSGDDGGQSRLGRRRCSVRSLVVGHARRAAARVAPGFAPGAEATSGSRTRDASARATTYPPSPPGPSSAAPGGLRRSASYRAYRAVRPPTTALGRCAAVLLLAFSVMTVVGTPRAQAQTTFEIWSATLTAAEVGGLELGLLVGYQS